MTWRKSKCCFLIAPLARRYPGDSQSGSRYFFVKKGNLFQIVEVNTYLHCYGLDHLINKQALLSEEGMEWVLCVGPEKGKVAGPMGESPGGMWHRGGPLAPQMTGSVLGWCLHSKVRHLDLSPRETTLTERAPWPGALPSAVWHGHRNKPPNSPTQRGAQVFLGRVGRESFQDSVFPQNSGIIQERGKGVWRVWW